MSTFFEYDIRLNGLDVDGRGQCKASALLNHLQNAATLAAEDGGFSRETLVERYGDYERVLSLFRGVWENGRVDFTGFEDHKDYAVMTKQTTGFSGMISFELDSLETTMNLLSRVKLIMFAESLGGVESLVTYPMTQTHESIPVDVREALGLKG